MPDAVRCASIWRAAPSSRGFKFKRGRVETPESASDIRARNREWQQQAADRRPVQT